MSNDEWKKQYLGMRPSEVGPRAWFVNFWYNTFRQCRTFVVFAIGATGIANFMGLWCTTTTFSEVTSGGYGRCRST